MRIVPVEVDWKKITIDHNTGVLEGIGGIHEIIDADMGGGEDFFTGNKAIFINGEALAANNHHTGMGKEVFNLFLEAIRQGNIVGVHASYKAPFGLLQTEIEGLGDLQIGLIAIYMEAGVDMGVFVENLVGSVGGSVINGNYLKVSISLVSKAF